MYVLSILLRLALVSLPIAFSAPLETQTHLSQSSDLEHSARIPTRYESAVLGRRLLALSTTGVISSIFPPNKPSSSPSQSQSEPEPSVDILAFTPPPASVASLSISLPDYLSDCDNPSTGNPTLLFLDPSTSSRNSRSHTHTPHHPTNISLSLSWWDSYPLLTGHLPWAPADLPRLSMIGYLEEVSLRDAQDTGIVACYLRAHPDARLWLPGDEHAAHGGRWLRLRVQEVYWMGGFGDRHFIGWLDVGQWRGVTEEEWRAVRLPGEKV